MKTLIFDLDGTMYRGKAPIPEAVQAVKNMKEKNIPYLFLTNNAMRSPEENRRHMEQMGYEFIEDDQFYNSSMAAAQYVIHHYSQRKAWFIGNNGLRQALLEAGFELDDVHPDFVFVGMDQNADYHLYSKGLDYLLKGAKLIGTNSDRMLANPNGFDIGNGAVVKMFEYASGQTSPKIGKPNRYILEYCLEHFDLKPEDVILIGDNLETDIALGYNNQVKTVFVESGVHNRNDIERLKIYPDLVVKSLDELDLEQLAKGGIE